MHEFSLGLLFFCRNGKYNILDNYFTKKTFELNYGDLIINLSYADINEILSIICDMPTHNISITPDNISHFTFKLLKKLQLKYDFATSVLIFTELNRHLDDYINYQKDWIKDMENDTSDLIRDKQIFFKDMGYDEIGDSTLKHLILSAFFFVSRTLENIKNILYSLYNIEKKEESDKIIKLFTKAFHHQKTELAITIIDENFVQLYNSTSVMSAVAFDIYKLIENNIMIKKCENCNKFFTPKNRSDTIFCNRISPQDSQKTCQEYGRYANYLAKSQTELSVKLYKQIYNSLSNKIKRNPESIEFRNTLSSFQADAKRWKEEIKFGKSTTYDYELWLKHQKETIYTKSKAPTKN